MSASWFCTNDVDGRVLLNGRPPVKLVDNIVMPGQSVVTGTLWEPTTTQRAAPTRYLNNLYLAGAAGGLRGFPRQLDSTQAGGARCPVGRFTGQLDRRANPAASTRRATTSSTPVLRRVAAPCRRAGASLQRVSAADQRRGPQRISRLPHGGQRRPVGQRRQQSEPRAGRALRRPGGDLSGAVRHETAEPLVTNTQQKVEFHLLAGGTQNNTFITSTDSHNLCRRTRGMRISRSSSPASR